MTKLNKARIQRLDPSNGQPIEDVDVLTSADCVNLESGETVEVKLGAIDNVSTVRIDEILDGVIPNKPSTKPSNFYNKQQTDNRIKEEIAKAKLDGNEVNLEPYATKDYVELVVENIQLKPGPKGDQGEKGQTGEQGKQGKPGATGAAGKTPVFRTTDEGLSWKYNSDLDVVANLDSGDNVMEIYGNDVIKKMKISDNTTKSKYFKILQVEGFIANGAGEIMMILKLDHQSQRDISFLKVFNPKNGIQRIPSSKVLDANLDMEAVAKEFMEIARLTPIPNLEKMVRFDIKVATYDREKNELNNNLMIFMISEDTNEWMPAFSFANIERKVDNGIQMWSGAQEEYDAIKSKNPKTLYIIEE